MEAWLVGIDGGARWQELGVTPINSFDAFNLRSGCEYHFRGKNNRSKCALSNKLQLMTHIRLIPL